MFTDPQSITVNGVAKSMPRVESTGKQSIYRSADGNFQMKISHQVVARDRIRSTVRVDQRAVVTDPLSSESDYDTLSFYCVLDRPNVGFSLTEVGYIVSAFDAWLTASSLAAVGKLYGMES